VVESAADVQKQTLKKSKLATAAIKSNFGQKQLLEICIFQATIENCKSFLTVN
jgi:hypothetical protein